MPTRLHTQDRATIASTPPQGRGSFIPEIQGLRTVALLLVASFHVWFGKVSGGVDIFLMVSAFLMTRSLTGRRERGIKTNPLAFLVRKFARLLPAAVAAIVLTLVAVVIVLPMSTWQQTFEDAWASALYYQNFNLQAQATDYFNANQATASVFQHFWSLSIQGQVFVIWALIHFVADWIIRKPSHARPVLGTVFALVFAASLAYSVWFTSANQTMAYFDTWARLWEFAFGSLLALVHGRFTLPTWLRTIMSWIGVAAVLSCGFVMPVESSFPGFAALWPVTAAGLIILASGRPTKVGADRVLTAGILRKIGSYTYALYLTHWPVLVIYEWAIQRDAATLRDGTLVLMIAALLAVVIVHAVERPAAAFNSTTQRAEPTQNKQQPASGTNDAHVATARRPLWANARALLSIGLCVLTVWGATTGGSSWLEHTRSEQLAALQNFDPSRVGVNAPDFAPDVPVPSIDFAPNDWSNPGEPCATDDPFATAMCYEINVEKGSPERRILLIGNSHITQYVPVISEIIDRHPTWAMRTQVAPGCSLIMGTDVDVCRELWDTALRYIESERPDMVIIHGTVNSRTSDATSDEVINWLGKVRSASPETTVVALRDNQRMNENPITCVPRDGLYSETCQTKINHDVDQDYVSELQRNGAVWVDLNDRICPDRICRPSLGGVTQFLDDNHLTATFARTMSQAFSDVVAVKVPWWPKDAYAGESHDRLGDEPGSADDLNSIGS